MTPLGDRDAQVDRIAAALRETGIAEHHDGTEWSDAAAKYAAEMLYDAGLRVAALAALGAER